MNDMNQDRAIAEIQTGLAREEGRWVCQICGESFEEGEVYPFEGRFFDARHAARRHAATAHGDPLARLLAGQSRYMTLTENQKALLQMMAGGASDAEIAAATETTAATVRRQRFAFREKARQARMYLAAYGLAGIERPNEAALPAPRPAPQEAPSSADTEEKPRWQTAFYTLDPPRLKALPAKDKRRRGAIRYIAGLFTAGRGYTEKQVNAMLQTVHPEEYVTLRRYLIEYGFLAREKDGSRYWVAE